MILDESYSSWVTSSKASTDNKFFLFIELVASSHLLVADIDQIANDCACHPHKVHINSFIHMTGLSCFIKMIYGTNEEEYEHDSHCYVVKNNKDCNNKLDDWLKSICEEGEQYHKKPNEIDAEESLNDALISFWGTAEVISEEKSSTA